MNHLINEHNLELSEEEKKSLEMKNCSAILQAHGKGKAPLLSFLEPLVKKDEGPKLSPNAIKGLLSAALQQSGTPEKSGDIQAMSSEIHKVPNVSPFTSPNPPPPPPPLAPPGSQRGEGGPPRAPNGFDFPSPHHIPNVPTTSTPQSLMMENLNMQSALLRNQVADALAGNARKSPPQNNNNGDISPNLLNSHSPLALPGTPGFPSNANMLQGTTIGACPDHVNGMPTGMECAKCDMILNSSRMPGGLGWNAARNTCKTLKCPKCNWHYKYQETLEIHMKEKHPEAESNCIYCVTGQQHPRLARGETYTCGYKPYRCEVCNYSTTTKGNLSIHMQSDKHLNNMQELQNGAVVAGTDATQLPSSALARGGPGMPPINLAALAKAKPSWRCDVCNYETNVARNLRIHMTSEKHTHNIMVIQQNVKHIQQMSQGGPNGGGPNPSPLAMFPPLPGLENPQQLLQMQLGMGGIPGLPPLPGMPGVDKQPGQNEAAMADMAFLQAIMMQMMAGGGQLPSGGALEAAGIPSTPSLDSGLNPENMEPPPEPADPNPDFLFTCCVCNNFGCDNLDALSMHLTQDRTRNREFEVSIVIAGNFICKLCQYKTNLKANFQLHCKTDKHLQRLNHVNHIKEGGPANEWKLKFLNVTNPVQLRCNACDYYTNSMHKMQLHVANQRHEISTILFSHLKKAEMAVPDKEKRGYHCSLCNYTGPGKLALMAHVRSMKHLQMEQLHQLQKRTTGSAEQTDIGDIFKVIEKQPEQSEGAEEQLSANNSSEESNSPQTKSIASEKGNHQPLGQPTENGKSNMF